MRCPALYLTWTLTFSWVQAGAETVGVMDDIIQARERGYFKKTHVNKHVKKDTQSCSSSRHRSPHTMKHPSLIWQGQSCHLLLSPLLSTLRDISLQCIRHTVRHSCITEHKMKEERVEGEGWIEGWVNECTLKIFLDLWGDSYPGRPVKSFMCVTSLVLDHTHPRTQGWGLISN